MLGVGRHGPVYALAEGPPNTVLKLTAHRPEVLAVRLVQKARLARRGGLRGFVEYRSDVTDVGESQWAFLREAVDPIAPEYTEARGYRKFADVEGDGTPETAFTLAANAAEAWGKATGQKGIKGALADYKRWSIEVAGESVAGHSFNPVSVSLGVIADEGVPLGDVFDEHCGVNAEGRLVAFDFEVPVQSGRAYRVAAEEYAAVLERLAGIARALAAEEKKAREPDGPMRRYVVSEVKGARRSTGARPMPLAEAIRNANNAAARNPDAEHLVELYNRGGQDGRVDVDAGAFVYVGPVYRTKEQEAVRVAPKGEAPTPNSYMVRVIERSTDRVVFVVFGDRAAATPFHQHLALAVAGDYARASDNKLAPARHMDGGAGVAVARADEDVARRLIVGALRAMEPGVFIAVGDDLDDVPMPSTEAQEEHDAHVWVGLPVPTDAAPSLAVVGGERAEDLHITVSFIGSKKDLTAAAMKALPDVLAKIAAETPPLRVVTGEVRAFDVKEGPVPWWRSIRDPEPLQALRDRVEAALAAAGVETDKRFPNYTPHITIAYGDKPETLAVTRELEFGALRLNVGKTTHDFAFTGASLDAEGDAMVETLQRLLGGGESPAPAVAADDAGLESQGDAMVAELQRLLGEPTEAPAPTGDTFVPGTEFPEQPSDPVPSRYESTRELRGVLMSAKRLQNTLADRTPVPGLEEAIEAAEPALRRLRGPEAMDDARAQAIAEKAIGPLEEAFRAHGNRATDDALQGNPEGGVRGWIAANMPMRFLIAAKLLQFIDAFSRENRGEHLAELEAADDAYLTLMNELIPVSDTVAVNTFATAVLRMRNALGDASRLPPVTEFEGAPRLPKFLTAPAPEVFAPPMGRSQAPAPEVFAPPLDAATTPVKRAPVAAPGSQTREYGKNVAKVLRALSLDATILEGRSARALVKRPPYLPLHIESRDAAGGRRLLTLAHYYDDPGEPVLNVEMELSVEPGGELTFVSATATGGHKTTRDPTLAQVFARNLVQQGWGDDKSKLVELEIDGEPRIGGPALEVQRHTVGGEEVYVPPRIYTMKAAAEDALGVTATDLLGGGANGNVYRTGDGRVLKITTDEAEVCAVQLARARRAKYGDAALPGVVVVPTDPVFLGMVDENGKKELVFAFVRADVTPMTRAEMKALPRVVRGAWKRGFIDYGDEPESSKDDALEWAYKIADGWRLSWSPKFEPNKNYKQRAKLRDAMIAEYREVLAFAAKTMPQFRAIIDTVLRLLDDGYVAMDAVPRNIGRDARGEYVLFDWTAYAEVNGEAVAVRTPPAPKPAPVDPLDTPKQRRRDELTRRAAAVREAAASLEPILHKRNSRFLLAALPDPARLANVYVTIQDLDEYERAIAASEAAVEQARKPVPTTTPADDPRTARARQAAALLRAALNKAP